MSEYDNRALRVVCRRTVNCQICHVQIDRGDRLCKVGPLVSCRNHEQELVEYYASVKAKNRERSRTLDDEQVREARRLWATGDWTQAAIGDKFGVSQHAIHDVVNWKTFKDVK